LKRTARNELWFAPRRASNPAAARMSILFNCQRSEARRTADQRGAAGADYYWWPRWTRTEGKDNPISVYRIEKNALAVFLLVSSRYRL
jgi:hypothetical protein